MYVCFVQFWIGLSRLIHHEHDGTRQVVKIRTIDAMMTFYIALQKKQLQTMQRLHGSIEYEQILEPMI